MNSFKSKNISTETLGEYLRHAREALGFSLQDIRRLTQIPKKSLEALEAGNYEVLPADVYVRGFLKSLAFVYRIEADGLLAQFDKERNLSRTLTTGSVTHKPPKTYRLPRFVITPKILTVAFVIVLVMASVGYLIWQIYSVSAAPELTVTYPSADLTIGTQSMLLRGVTQPGARVFVNAQAIRVDENGEFKEVLNFVEGNNLVTVRAENKFGKSSTVQRRVLVAAQPPQDAATSTPPAILTAAINLEVIIGPDDTWLKVLADGKVVQDAVVPAGQRLVFTADAELLLSTGNAGSTRVRYNGTDLGVLGSHGEILSNIKFSK
jgi:transcriptional regulator with XRE-family HTH domain